jgi:glucosylceramidase
VDLWGLTVENEPGTGFFPNYKFNCLGLTPEMERDFVKMNLGPTLAKAGYGTDRVKLMVQDDSRDTLIKWVDVVFADKEAVKYVSGIAFHWYANRNTPISIMDKVHDAQPEYFLLSTEACNGLKDGKLMLGGWENGESYAYDIITVNRLIHSEWIALGLHWKKFIKTLFLVRIYNIGPQDGLIGT